MKKIFSSPYVVIASYSLIIISGMHTGNIFLLYIIMGLMVFATHAIIGIAGIFMLIVGNRTGEPWKKVLSVTGCGLLWLSLIVFFMNDDRQYNYGTFYQGIPLATMIVFGGLSVLFIFFRLNSSGNSKI